MNSSADDQNEQQNEHDRFSEEFLKKSLQIIHEVSQVNIDSKYLCTNSINPPVNWLLAS